MLALVSLAARPAAQDAARLDIRGYYTLVTQYLESDPDGAVDALQKHPPNTSLEILAMMQRDWSVDTMRAAAMLETDAAFAQDSLRILTVRLGHARSWLRTASDALPRGARDDFARQWYVVVGRKLLDTSMVAAADGMLREACDEFRDDAAIFLTYGLTRETSAFAVDGSETLEAIASRRPTFPAAPEHERRTALLGARSALRRALELDPQSVEGTLRLAHVYLRLDDERRAVPLLEQVLSGSPPEAYAYIASLLLGDVRARGGQLQQAIDLYLRARALVPAAQSAYIAHAHALRAAGQTEAAATVISDMLGRAIHGHDPWRRYPLGLDESAADLTRLRALLRKG